MAEQADKVRYITSGGAIFVPGGRVDAATIAGKVAAGEWRLASKDEIAAFLGTHPPTKAKREPRRPANDEE